MFRQWGSRERLLAENRRLQDALAAAEAPGRPDPGSLAYLFVVTYGRSGSTLLMGLLNVLPGYCIRGENQGILYDLFQYHTKAMVARETQRHDAPLTTQHPWYGIDAYPDQVAATRIRQLVVDTLLRPVPGTRVTGFKEVRWWLPKLMEYLEFVDLLFPGARFLLNTRNLDDAARSGWHQDKPEGRQKLVDADAGLRRFLAPYRDRTYHVHYDDYVADPASLRGMYEWLGEEYDPERVAQVLSVEHSFGNRRPVSR